MNKIYGFQIDALRLCFEAEEPEFLDFFATIDIGEKIEFYEFYLLRIEGKHFEYVYEIRYDYFGEDKLFGELRFGIKRNDNDANTHTNGLRKVWISISNRVLYSEFEFHSLGYITDKLCLNLHNITCLDLSLDMSMNIGRYLKKLIRCKELDIILNGKKIKNRKEDRPEIDSRYSGDLDRDKYLTFYVKQKKAMKDKSRGIILTAYDKLAEIRNISGKNYILELYGEPKKLHRLEVHLNNDDIKDYFNKSGEELNIGILYNEKFLFGLFYSTLESLIRFERKGKIIEWWDVLEKRVITTTPEKTPKNTETPLQQAS